MCSNDDVAVNSKGTFEKWCGKHRKFACATEKVVTIFDEWSKFSILVIFVILQGMT